MSGGQVIIQPTEPDADEARRVHESARRMRGAKDVKVRGDFLRLRAEGLSYGAIASRLGVSRSVICGHATRAGLNTPRSEIIGCTPPVKVTGLQPRTEDQARRLQRLAAFDPLAKSLLEAAE